MIDEYTRLALDLIIASVSAYLMFRHRARCEAMVEEAYREHRSWWLHYRDVRLQNQRLREENKTLRHRIEGRL